MLDQSNLPWQALGHAKTTRTAKSGPGLRYMAMMTVNGLGVGGILRQFQSPLSYLYTQVNHRTRVLFIYDMCDFLTLEYGKANLETAQTTGPSNLPWCGDLRHSADLKKLFPSAMISLSYRADLATPFWSVYCSGPMQTGPRTGS